MKRNKEKKGLTPEKYAALMMRQKKSTEAQLKALGELDKFTEEDCKDLMVLASVVQKLCVMFPEKSHEYVKGVLEMLKVVGLDSTEYDKMLQHDNDADKALSQELSFRSMLKEMTDEMKRAEIKAKVDEKTLEEIQLQDRDSNELDEMMLIVNGIQTYEKSVCGHGTTIQMIATKAIDCGHDRLAMLAKGLYVVLNAQRRELRGKLEKTLSNYIHISDYLAHRSKDVN